VDRELKLLSFIADKKTQGGPGKLIELFKIFLSLLINCQTIFSAEFQSNIVYF